MVRAKALALTRLSANEAGARQPYEFTWQRLFLVEMFEPRRRTVDVAVLG